MKKVWPLLALVAAIVICYAPALQNGFVWDDTGLVLRDPLIRSWRLAGEAFNHFLFLDATASNFFRAVQRLSYLLDYALFAFRPAGYHFSSIVYHILAAGAFFSGHSRGRRTGEFSLPSIKSGTRCESYAMELNNQPPQPSLLTSL